MLRVLVMQDPQDQTEVSARIVLPGSTRRLPGVSYARIVVWVLIRQRWVQARRRYACPVVRVRAQDCRELFVVAIQGSKAQTVDRARLVLPAGGRKSVVQVQVIRIM